MTHLWTRRPRLLEPHDALAVPGPRMEGVFEIEVVDTATGRVRERRVAKNRLVNAALNAWFVGTNCWGPSTLNSNGMREFMAIGTGTAVPTATDTTLGAEVGARVGLGNGTVLYSSGPPDYAENATAAAAFGAAYVGTFSEVGLFSASAGGIMACRALITDLYGNPAPITKDASVTLNITHRLRVYPPADDVTTVIAIGGVDYEFTLRPACVDVGDNGSSGNAPGWRSVSYWSLFGSVPIFGQNLFNAKLHSATPGLSARTGVLPAVIVQLADPTYGGYVANQFYRDVNWTLTGIARDLGHLSLLGHASFPTVSLYQCRVRKVSDGTALTKPNGVTFSIGARLTLSNV